MGWFSTVGGSRLQSRSGPSGLRCAPRGRSGAAGRLILYEYEYSVAYGEHAADADDHAPGLLGGPGALGTKEGTHTPLAQNPLHIYRIDHHP